MLSYRIGNIKSFVDSKEIEVKPITIFVGRNSCGKSSLVRFPAVLAQTAIDDGIGPIKFFGKMVDYGNYEDVLHHGSSTKMSFDMTYRIDSRAQVRNQKEYSFVRKIFDVMADDREITLRVTLDKPNKRLSVDKLELFTDDKCLYQICRSENNTYTFHVNYSYVNGKYICAPFYVRTAQVSFEKFIPYFDRNEILKNVYEDVLHENMTSETWERFITSFYRKTPLNGESEISDKESLVMDRWSQLHYYADLMHVIYDCYITESKNTRYIGPFRADPARIYRDQESVNTSVGVHGENTSNELIRDFRKKDAVLIKTISEWTKRVLGYEITIREVSNGLFQVMLRNENGIETNLIDNGYGISQVLPIITQVIGITTQIPIAETGSRYPERMLLLEQPEIHLHPAAQSELADLFAECALSGQTKHGYVNKLLIETHSEHLIRKLQILIASKDSELTKDMVAVYYVDKDENGEAYIEEMKILDNGKFETEWPSGFFDRGYQLSRELARAGIQD